MHLKKMTRMVLTVATMAIALSGCSQKAAPQIVQTENLSIYATFYPLYACTAWITENVPDVELHCLIQPQDACLRNYTLSDWDLALLAGSADVVIAGGEGLESFEDILYALGENGPSVLSLFAGMDLMDSGAIHPSIESDSETHWSGDNPHIYMSIDGAIEICTRIANGLSILDAAHSDLYAANLQAAKAELESLRAELQAALSFAAGQKVIVMNEALLYLAQEYGLEIDLCCMRESGEDTFDGDLSTADSKIILIEKQAPQSLCRQLQDRGYHLVKLDVLSTRRADEGFQGYISAMRSNAQALADALQGANAAV